MQGQNILSCQNKIDKTVYLPDTGAVVNLCTKFLFMHYIREPQKTILLLADASDFHACENAGVIFMSGKFYDSPEKRFTFDIVGSRTYNYNVYEGIRSLHYDRGVTSTITSTGEVVCYNIHHDIIYGPSSADLGASSIKHSNNALYIIVRNRLFV